MGKGTLDKKRQKLAPLLWSLSEQAIFETYKYGTRPESTSKEQWRRQ